MKYYRYLFAFLLGGLFLSACKNQAVSTAVAADVIYYNGTILTMEEDQKEVTAVAIKEGKILEIGTSVAVGKHNGADTKMIDLASKTLLPGFVDAHSHIGLAMAIVDHVALLAPPVGTIKNIGDIISRLKEHQTANNIKEGEWIIGWGYDPDQLEEQRHPNKLDLDEAFPDNPVYLSHVSGHMCVVNSQALDMAKIDGKFTDPPGGHTVKLPNTNEPSGLLQEATSFAMRGHLPVPTYEESLLLLEKIQNLYASRGITTAQDGITDVKSMQFLQAAAAAGKLKIDIEALASFQYAKEFLGNPKFPFGERKDRLRIAGMKIISDGSPQGKTAFFSKPYLTEVPGCAHNCTGIPILPLDQLTQLVTACYQSNVQLYTHANGDGAIDLLLQAHESAVETLKDSTKDLRTVIIHSQFVRSDQLEKYADYKMVPSFFTNHAFFWGDVHINNLGIERASFLSPLQTATDMGITYTNHTDYIVTPLSQLFLLWTAVNRQTRAGKILGPTERISPWDGLKAVTINAAYQHKLENSRGSIKVGKLADFVILDRNPLIADPSTLKDIVVLETIKEGVSIFEKGE